MRIARILTRLNVGGPALTALEVSRRLVELGHETTLFHGASGPLEGDLSSQVPPGVGCVRVAGLGRAPHALRDLTALAGLRRSLARFRPDIIHTHAAKAGALGRLAVTGWVRRPRLVHTFHGHVLSGYFGPLVSRGYATLERWLARRTDRLIAVSPRVRDDLVERHGVGRRSDWSIVPGGLLPAGGEVLGRLAARRRLGLPEQGPVVGVVARLAPIKGHAVLLDALARISTPLPTVAFLGDGPLRRVLEERARDLGVDPLIVWAGWVPQPRRLLAALDLIVLPSLAEGLPLCLLEAMAAGRPIVASAAGGVGDLIESGVDGLLVEPNDPSGLAAAIERILSDSELAGRLGEQASRKAADYGIERHVASLVGIYQDLLRGSPAGPAKGRATEEGR